MLFLKLFFSFFKIGLFSFGGGYSMIPLLQSELVYDQAWMSSAEFTNIVALSQMTPGPIGVNAATYCGYTAAHNAGMSEWLCTLGSATATFALILPSSININPWQFWISVFIFAATFIGTRIMKINPIRMICWAAFAGLMLLY